MNDDHQSGFRAGWDACREDQRKHEGPNPKGMVAKLRRERDEAREERNRAEARLAQAVTVIETTPWRAVGKRDGIKVEYTQAGTAYEWRCVGKQWFRRVLTLNYADMPDWFVLPPEDDA